MQLYDKINARPSPAAYNTDLDAIERATEVLSSHFLFLFVNPVYISIHKCMKNRTVSNADDVLGILGERVM